MASSPKILAIDTAYAACSVALQIGQTVFSHFTATERRHNELILPMVQQILTEANIQLSELSAIAFGCGPGSFTGVRIAASVVQGLAYAATLPVIRVSSLQAIAQNIYHKTAASRILVGIDARMQAIYWAGFVAKQGIMQPEIAEQQTAILDFKPATGDWLVVGDAWQAYPQLARSTEWAWADNDWQPSAVDLLPMALAKYHKQELVPAELALPTYFSDSHWRKLPGRG